MTPITRFTITFATGILLAVQPGGLPPASAAATVLCAGALGGVLLLARTSGPVLRGALLIFLIAGWAAGGTAAGMARRHCIVALPDDVPIVLTGAWEAVPVSGVPTAFRVSAVHVAERVLPCHGTLRARARVAVDASAGTAVQLAGRWRAHPQFGGWPQRPAFAGVFSVDSVAGGQAGAAMASGGLRARLHAARGAVQQRLRRLYPQHWPLAEALVLARREGLDHEVRARFVASGMTHLLAISGTHVALFAGFLLLVAGLARQPPRRACALAAGGAVAYVLFIGAPHAAARAALQLGIFLLARVAQRPVDAISAVALAALTLLVTDPLALLDPGFQLSFAGVLGIARLRRPLLDRLPDFLPHALRDAIATGLAASVPTTPIAALHFQHYALIGVPASIVAVPVLACAVPAVVLTMAIDQLAPAVAAFLAAGSALLLGALDTLARWAATVPGGHGYVTPHVVVSLLAAAAIGSVLLRRAPPAARRTVAWKAAALACSVAWLLPPALTRAGRGVEIHAIDVGQGDALAIRSPRGRWILVDAGPAAPGYDAGERTVVPYLRRRGVRRIDALVLTHPHADHVGGAAAVLRAFRVGVVIEPAAPAASSLYLAALEAAAERSVTWLTARAGRAVRVGELELEFLYPADDVLDAAMDPNDYSAVFGLRYGTFHALFFGDAPASVENALVRRHGNAMRAHVIKVGHHGSRTSTGDSLLLHAAPVVAIVSAGRRNRYGHPTREVMERLDRYGVRTLRTDSAGSMRIGASAAGALRMP